jgi:hypothetical protein
MTYPSQSDMWNLAQAQAAEDLQGGLRQLSTKLNDLVQLRASKRSALLGSPSSDNWQGPDRDTYERQYAAQQAALTALATTAVSLASSIQEQIWNETRCTPGS